MAFAGISLVADGKLCASTMSPVDSGADSGYHLLVVEGYSRTKETTPNGVFIKSRPFIVGGRRWVLQYSPNGFHKDDEEFMSVFLVLDEDVIHGVDAHVAFSFIDQPELRVSTRIRESQEFCFASYNPSGQPCRFIRKEILERSTHLKNDSFIIWYDVVVVESDEKNTNEQGTRTTALPFIKLPPSNLQSHLSELLLSKEGADITFEVGSDKLAAHRCVLGARSTVFKAQLLGAMNGSSVVKISDIKANVFRGLLTFIYTDAVPDFVNMEAEDEMEEDDDEVYATRLLQFLEAAERYDLQRLKSICEEKLADFICANTVADIIVMTERRRCRWLKESCLEFIKTHTSLHTVFTAEGLEQIIRTCSPSVLKELLSKFAT